MAEPPRAFTGRTRHRKTRPLIRLTDRLSRVVITVGGISTIVAVMTVAVFLAFVVWPLFEGATVTPKPPHEGPWDGPPLRLSVDDYRVAGWAFMPDGTVHLFRLDTGESLDVRSVLGEGDPPLAAVSFATAGEDVVLALADGSLRLGAIRFATTFREGEDVPQELQDLGVGEVAPYGGGMVEKTPIGQYRVQKLEMDFTDLAELGVEAEPLAVAHAAAGRQTVFATLTKDGRLRAVRADRKTSMLTGRTRFVPARTYDLPLPEGRPPPKWVLVSELGVNVYAAWPDGHLLRYNVRDVPEPKVAEEVDLVPRPGARLTALDFLIGDMTLIAGDSEGRLRGYFTAEDPTNPVDGRSLVVPHEFGRVAEAAVTALRSSTRSRAFAAGFADGTARLFHMTSQKRLAAVRPQGGEPITNVAIAPKDDALIVAADGKLHRYGFDPGYPEATLHTLFAKVWYEGYAEPTWVWASSSGHQSYEMKLSLVPLVFGTAKATLYSMLFGGPIALLAAVFTSEFLHPKAKARIKPAVELMASLPSVVLGFLAALVFAPLIERVIPQVMVGFIAVPLAILAGSYVWQALPRGFTLRMRHWRPVFILPAIASGVGLAWLVGPLFEEAYFAGDVVLWLHDPSVGDGTGAWLFMLVPPAALVMALFMARVVTPAIRQRGEGWSRARFAAVDVVKFVAGTAVALALAWAGSKVMVLAGLDPRATWDAGGVDVSPFGVYIQRNALIVGFVMGFAIIPIIYTIAEDALSTVPEHLRSASLGSGATPWQTAVRIVIPMAMSGLFSALMIGLGRAVGETMIVLMAAGNTPILKMNVFEGFRTLSANIATELPETVRYSTHYRTLFLAALVLFAMTFVINTLAELVRLRFRRKAVEL